MPVSSLLSDMCSIFMNNIRDEASGDPATNYKSVDFVTDVRKPCFTEITCSYI